ncbi:MAG TPA: WhiB family transcriptional regulator [Acidimicrobiia bacterium]|nr:WhiB family transcriptional regulator [Acidimicrobiia bacterium]
MADQAVVRTSPNRQYDPLVDLERGWRSVSACRDIPNESFVAVRLDSRQERAAKAVCASCMVVDECLAYAITHDVPYGVWGGLTMAERVRVRRSWLSSLAS